MSIGVQEQHSAEGEEFTYDEVLEELLTLVSLGWLEMGVDGDGNCCYWPTPEGAVHLGMNLV